MIDQPKLRVLVLCTHNSNRSQMAEGIFRALANDRLDVFSAGNEPRAVSQNAIIVLKEIGIDISGNRSKNINEFIRQKFDYVITVCEEAAITCPFFPGDTTRLHWPFEDPSQFTGNEQEILIKYRRVRNMIRDKISSWLGELGLLKK